MDPLRGAIHLGLKLTATTLDRALDVVKLADTLIVASAVPSAREGAPDEPNWPEEEQADLDALSATLRARKDSGSTPTRRAAARKAASSSAKKAASSRTPSAQSSAKQSTAKKASPAKKSAAKRSAAKRSAAKKSAAKKTTAKKAATKKTTAQTATAPGVAETPTLVVLPDE